MGYYMGDFYRGDPGFWDVLRKVGGAAVGMLPIPGARAIGGLIGGAMPGGGAPVMTVNPMSLTGAAGGRAGAIVKRGVQLMKGHPVTTAAAGAGAAGMLAGMGLERGVAGMGGTCGKGHHQRRPLKHCGIPLKSGKCGKCYRSMNVCNPHALRRAIRRTRGFAKLAMRTIHIVHPKKKGRFGGFKKRRKS